MSARTSRAHRYRKSTEDSRKSDAVGVCDSYLQESGKSLSRRCALAVPGGFGNSGWNVGALCYGHRLSQHHDVRGAAAREVFARNAKPIVPPLVLVTVSQLWSLVAVSGMAAPSNCTGTESVPA